MVKCQECGLLGLRDPHSTAILEADRIYRTEGSRANALCNAIGPLCLPHAADLEKERQQSPGDERRQHLTVVSLERECSSFYAWVQGFSPKEHLEIMYQAELRREIEERRIADQQWREEQSRINKEWQERRDTEQRNWQEEENQKNRSVQFWARAFSAIVGVLGGIIGWLLRSGKP